jgi:hypothetical protein
VKIIEESKTQKSQGLKYWFYLYVKPLEIAPIRLSTWLLNIEASREVPYLNGVVATYHTRSFLIIAIRFI